MIFNETVGYIFQMSFVLRYVLKRGVKENVVTFINFYDYAFSSDDKIQDLNNKDNIITLESKFTEIFLEKNSSFYT